MAIRSGFFNSISGDRVYNATNFAEYFSTFVGNGVFAQPANGLQVVSNSNLSLIVRAGKAWINGYYLVNDSNHTITLDAADSTLNRIDRIVVRLDFTTRLISITVKKGTPGSAATAQGLQRDANAYELCLADVYIAAGATQILQTNITDQRFNTSLCGIVKGLIDQIDTTDLFAQYNTAFNNWFATITNILNSNAAGNLQNQITAIDTRLKKLDFNTAEQTIYFSPTGVDTNTGLTASVPKKSIQTFINSLPQNLNKKVTLILLQGSYADQGQIEISNFRGAGDFVLQGQTSNRNLFSVSNILISGCSNVNTINFLNFTTTTKHAVEIDKCHYASVGNISAFGLAPTFHGVRVSASSANVFDSDLTGKRYAIFAENNSQVLTQNNTGTSNEIGLYSTSGSTIVKVGTAPTGTVNEYTTAGGVIR